MDPYSGRLSIPPWPLVKDKEYLVAQQLNGITQKQQDRLSNAPRLKDALIIYQQGRNWASSSPSALEQQSRTLVGHNGQKPV